METQPAFGFKELLVHVVGGMARTVSERPGETRQQHMAQSAAAAQMIMAFLPRDVVEALLAGHCVMLHELMVEGVRDLLGGEADTARRSTRAGIVALDRAFGANLTKLERYQSRRADGIREDAELPVPETNAAAPPPASSNAGGGEADTVTFGPSAEAIAACHANPAAMAALDAGDAAGFARAMGIEMPKEAYIAAAGAQMKAFNRGEASPPMSR